MNRTVKLTLISLACTAALLLFVYADSSTYALGAGQAGWVSCTQANCASSATTILVAPVTTMYRINATVACTSSTATATAILIVKYTDPSSTVQTLTLATATCTALGSLSISSLDQGQLFPPGRTFNIRSRRHFRLTIRLAWRSTRRA